MDSSLHFLFGLDPRKRNGAPFTAHEFHEIWLAGLMQMGLRFIIGWLMWLIPTPGYAKLIKQIQSFVEFYVERNSAELETDSAKRENLAQILVAGTEDKVFIRNQLIQGMVGNQDTTSTLAGNTVELMARNPALWKELRNEVLDKGDSLISFDTLRTNRIIQNLLKESKFCKLCLHWMMDRVWS